MRSARAAAERADEPVSLHTLALRNLRYIRETIETSLSLVTVPGMGGVAMGVIGLLAAALCALPALSSYALYVWLGAAPLAAAVGGYFMRQKARRMGVTLSRGAGRRFLLCLCPPLVAGAALTPVLSQIGASDVIPGMWLLLYGTAAIAAGTASIPPVIAMGACFMALGALTLVAPASWANAMLAAGFGGLHVLFGLIIARNHGG